MKRLLLLLVALMLLVDASAGAQPKAEISRFRPDLPPPTPPQLTAAPKPEARLAQALSCRQALADPSVSLAPAESPWLALRGARSFSSEQPFSPPQSLLLEIGPADGAAVGQQFGPLPSALTELAGALRFRYASGSTEPGDLLRVELYEVPITEGANPIARRELEVGGLDDGSWRSFEWEILDESTLTQLRERSGVIFAVSAVNAAGGAQRRLWLDELTLDLCAPGAAISGQVVQSGSGAPNADVLLVRSDAAGSRVTASARSGGDGSFGFGVVPPLTAGTSYRLWYLNNAPDAARDDSRLGFWAGPTIASLETGTTASGQKLEIDNVRLIGPEPNSSVVATDSQPARFSWGGRRGAPGERQRFCLYDPERADRATRLPQQLCGPLLDPSRDPLVFNLAPASFTGVPGLSLSYGRSYSWYVIVYSGDPAADPHVQYGYSFYERTVRFVPAAVQRPLPGPTLPPGDPAPGPAGADWTLLVYVAADNALGDPARTPRRSLPATQLAGLSAVALANPGVNIVTYQDDYGDGGAVLCAYVTGVRADCRSRPEPNTAGGQDLADVITYGRTRYPAARTALLIISPGAAVGGLAPDESAGGDSLSLQQLAAAYGAAGLGVDSKLDLVIYQASNLGSLEALTATAPYARYAVAPPDQVWQIGAIDRVVAVLSGAGRSDTAAAARGTVMAYQAALDEATPGRMFSMSAYDLGRVPALAAAAGDLAFVIGEALTSDRATLLPILEAARDGVHAYDSSGNGRQNQFATPGGTVAAREDALVDLRGLALRLREAVGTTGSVRDVTNDLIALMSGNATTPLLVSVQRSGVGLAGMPVSLDGALGLGVFFPSGDRLGGQPALSHAYLYGPQAGPPRDSDWATMLRIYLRERIGIGPGGVNEAPESGAQVRSSRGGLLETDLRLPLVRR